jgi:hypothetical protein
VAATAAHWFDRPLFYAEAARVLERADFYQNRDSQIGLMVIHRLCRDKAAGRDDATLFGRSA